MSSRKGQIWYSDFMVGILLFSIVVMTHFYYVEHTEYSDDTLMSYLVTESKAISATLIGQGYPSAWTVSNVTTAGLTDNDYRVNMTKLLSKTSNEAVNYTYNKIWSDGLKLSDRVWLLDKRTKQEIERIIMQNIVAGGSASDQMTISALTNLLNPDYKPAKLTSLHGRKVSYEASRLLRTESAIAFNILFLRLLSNAEIDLDAS